MDFFKKVVSLLPSNVEHALAKKFRMSENVLKISNNEMFISKTTESAISIYLLKNKQQFFKVLNDRMDLHMIKRQIDQFCNKKLVPKNESRQNVVKKIKKNIFIEKPLVEQVESNVSSINDIVPLMNELKDVLSTNWINKFLLEFRIYSEDKTFGYTNETLISFNKIFSLLKISLIGYENHYFLEIPLENLESAWSKEKLFDEITHFLQLSKDMEHAKTSRFSGDYPVILSPRASAVFFHETLGHGIEGDLITKGESIFSGLLGNKVASPLVSVVDDPRFFGTGYYEYDDEGTKSMGTILVEEGILMDFIHDKLTASKLNVISTSNARASSPYSPPLVRSSNMVIEPGQQDEDLFEDISLGFYIWDVRSAIANISWGEFSIFPQHVILVKNGELTNTFLKNVVFNGNVLTALRSIDAVGSSVENVNVSCRKLGHKIDVGVSSPPIRVASGIELRSVG